MGEIESVVTVPEDLYTQVSRFVQQNPCWTWDRVHQAALSLFLAKATGNCGHARTFVEVQFTLPSQDEPTSLG